jgi:(4-O-methyl)-D-glucuronate---lignin esterase
VVTDRTSETQSRDSSHEDRSRHVLPDPLVLADGRHVASPATWLPERRPEILKLFENHVYGRAPGNPATFQFAMRSQEKAALGGRAIRREVRLAFAHGETPKLDLLVYIPATRSRPAPVVLGPNFLGNHTVHTDPGIALPDIRFVPGMDVVLPEGRATERSRGFHASRWPIEQAIGRGFAVATFYYGDLYPDRVDGRPFSIQPLFEAQPRAYGWGAIATWAWGMSRALDALESMPELDASRVVLMGHSRHGKAALWAGALDTRFAIVVANNSGKGGASLARRPFGERVRDLIGRYPHWFAEEFRKYADRETEIPVDQHLLVAAIAPRPVYVASAEDDHWADPLGEFLGALNAGPVYRLFGREGLPAMSMPQPHQPTFGTIGYHVRAGGHDVTAYDWERFMDFAELHLGR